MKLSHFEMQLLSKISQNSQTIEEIKPLFASTMQLATIRKARGRLCQKGAIVISLMGRMILTELGKRALQEKIGGAQ